MALDAMVGIRSFESQPSKSAMIGAKMQTLLEFRGVVLPEDVMVNILEYLPKKELVHRVSLVNSSWRIASQNPTLWPSFGSKLWNDSDSEDPFKTMSIRYFLDILRRPQFSCFKFLAPPRSVQRPKNTTVWDRIAISCPQLEKLDLALAFGLQPKCDKELHRLPVLFPSFQGIEINGDTIFGNGVTENGLVKFAQLMGEKLRRLGILANHDDERYLVSDNTLETLSQGCPNLKEFYYACIEGSIQITSSGVLNFLPAVN